MSSRHRVISSILPIVGQKLTNTRPHVSGYFWIRNIFFPDTTTVNTHPPNSTAYPDICKSAHQSRQNIFCNEYGNLWTAESGYFRIESDDVAKSCPLSYRTINQYGATMCRLRANKAYFPVGSALYGARSEDILVQRSSGYCSKSGYHRMRVDRQIRFEYATCGLGIF